MITKYIIPLFAILGFVSALKVVASGASHPPTPLPVAAPVTSPFAAQVSGAGMVESSSENISVGTPLSGIVKVVAVQPGDRVKQGDLLFALDDSALQAQLVAKKAALEVARANANRAHVDYNQADSELKRAQGLAKGGATSKQDFDTARFALDRASAVLAQSQAQIRAAESEMAVVQTEILRSATRAQIDGEILQVNIRPGEYALAGNIAQPLILMGLSGALNLRVDIDEHDAWRVKADARGMAYLKGNRDIYSSLKFVRFEPYVIPKKSLTGSSSERVDTRVLQVIYRIESTLR